MKCSSLKAWFQYGQKGLGVNRQTVIQHRHHWSVVVDPIMIILTNPFVINKVLVSQKGFFSPFYVVNFSKCCNVLLVYHNLSLFIVLYPIYRLYYQNANNKISLLIIIV